MSIPTYTFKLHNLTKQAQREGIDKLKNILGFFNDDYKLINTEPEMKVVITKESD